MGSAIESAWRVMRGRLTNIVGQVAAESADATPPGCHNTLRWQLGHVIWASEGFIAKRAGHAVSIPDSFNAWFAINTSPADFTDETPGWEQLVAQLGTSTDHLGGLLSAAELDAELVEPLVIPQAGLAITTVGEAAAFALAHEAIHMGEISIYRLALAA